MKEHTEVLPVTAAYEFARGTEFAREMKRIEDMKVRWNRNYTSTVKRGYIVELLMLNLCYERFVRVHWKNGATPGGRTLAKRALRVKQEYEAHQLQQGK